MIIICIELNIISPFPHSVKHLRLLEDKHIDQVLIIGDFFSLSFIEVHLTNKMIGYLKCTT